MVLFTIILNFYLLKGAARNPTKFMSECRSPWKIDYLLIKQRDNYSVIKTALVYKFCTVSHCASAYPGRRKSLVRKIILVSVWRSKISADTFIENRGRY